MVYLSAANREIPLIFIDNNDLIESVGIKIIMIWIKLVYTSILVTFSVVVFYTVVVRVW